MARLRRRYLAADQLKPNALPFEVNVILADRYDCGRSVCGSWARSASNASRRMPMVAGRLSTSRPGDAGHALRQDPEQQVLRTDYRLHGLQPRQ